MTQDQQLDLIIVTIYAICVFYALRQAIQALDDRTKIKFDEKAFQKQLEDDTIPELNDLPLKELINVKFKFDDRYKFSDQPKKLSITIENKSSHTPKPKPETSGDSDAQGNRKASSWVNYSPISILVDWDSSSVTDYGTKSRRVIRLIPDKRLDDLSVPQVQSIVPPGGNLQADLTAEDVLKLDDAKTTMEPSKALLDLDDLKKAADNKKSPQSVKDMYAKFIKSKDTLKFSLRLMVHFITLLNGEQKRYPRYLYCTFIVENIPWTDELPWLPKK